MTPYTKKIVELHKIHKAIEEKDCNGGGNTPSGDITIDDVVKFMHDTINNVAPGAFPYTTWDEIPDIQVTESVITNKGIFKSTNSTAGFSEVYLYIPNYIIGYIEKN